MRLNISAWAIRNPIPPIVLFVLLFFIGLYGFRALPITEFPNMDIPVISVTITQAGSAPSELQNQVTKRVEDSISSVTGVKHIDSSITEGLSSTVIEFNMGTNTDRALNDVKDAITKIRSDLPSDIDEPLVQRFDFEGLPILTFVVNAPSMSQAELSWFVDDVIAREIKLVKGVGNVARIGGVEREIRVVLHPERLLSLGATAADMTRQLRAMNIDLPGGRSEMGEQEQTIRALGSTQSVEELSSLTISLSSGRKIRLDEIADVLDGGEEIREYAEFNGREVVGFSVSRAKGESDVSVGKAVVERSEKLKKLYPEIQFDIIENKFFYTEGVFENTMSTLFEGAILAIIVVFLFLRDIRATVIAALALPLSAIPTFFFMYELGFSLNMVSLLAISLVTGILVDDAIVEIENIVRHMRSGKSAYRASLEAADEIGLAVIAITFTIVAVFLPVGFMPGISGQIFRQFGLTVAIAVVISLLVARLITPLLAAFFLRDHNHEHEKPGVIFRLYERVLIKTVEHRFKIILLGFVIFSLSIASTQLLPTEFIPKSDVNRSYAVIELPPGSRLSDTRQKVDEIVTKIRKIPEVQSIFALGGNQLPNRKDIRLATLSINYSQYNERSRTQAELEVEIDQILQNTTDIRAFIMNDGGQREVQVIVAGSDEQEVSRAGTLLEQAMRRMPSIRNVTSSVPLGRPEIRIHPKEGLAAELGISTAAIAETVRVATIGDVSFNLPKFNAGDRQVPIRVQMPIETRADLSLLETLMVPTRSGISVPLASVANIETGYGPASISRYDRQLKIGVDADLTGSAPLGEVLANIRNLPVVKAFPEGIEVREAGDAEAMVEVFGNFGVAIMAGLLLMLGLLTVLFRNILQPFTILFSLPLSLGGAIMGLIITGKAISLPVFIGFLMLLGIVAKNAIMLVEFALDALRQGDDAKHAIIEAGRKRARPIVMTTIAMVAGMVPAALGLGQGGDFRSPMGVAVIGGLLMSTLLSLLFVPSFFLIMYGLEIRLKRWFRFLIGNIDEPDKPLENLEHRAI